jgi:hypothetical protein
MPRPGGRESMRFQELQVAQSGRSMNVVSDMEKGRQTDSKRRLRESKLKEGTQTRPTRVLYVLL